MDWARAIAINREALTRVVAGLMALLMVQGGRAERVSLVAYRLVLRGLYPAESAVRRLIVIAARGLVVPLLQARPMPKGIVRSGKPRERNVFPLFDTRKHFAHDDETPGNGTLAATRTGPRIRSVSDFDPRIPLFLSAATSTPEAEPDEPDDFVSPALASRLGRRLTSVKLALDNLGAQARRLARWRARKAVLKSPGFTTPMRPGRPPGHRKRSSDEIDRVLSECHALAWQALEPDTS